MGDIKQVLGDLPPALQAPIRAFERGDMPANIALMQLCMAAPDMETLRRAVSAAAGEADGGSELAAIWRNAPGSFDLVKRVLEVVDHGPSTDSADVLLANCAAAFDTAAALSPEASVALYSLGDPALLAAATSEIAGRMQGWGLLGSDKAALEIGCGNGRFLEVLAPGLGHVTGLDISAAMVEAARRRCSDLANVTVAQSSGRDLWTLRDASLDLVFAIDSLPYIVRCGADLVARHFAEAARVLCPSGHFLILNYSYRGDGDQDLAELLDLAAETGFSIMRAGVRDFRLWDGVTFLLQRQGA
jgi:2-polyprenyl-3-methyl-5-hydroxy-6-metoxy-1,4-benzoquinol methylase